MLLFSRSPTGRRMLQSATLSSNPRTPAPASTLTTRTLALLCSGQRSELSLSSPILPLFHSFHYASIAPRVPPTLLPPCSLHQRVSIPRHLLSGTAKSQHRFQVRIGILPLCSNSANNLIRSLLRFRRCTHIFAASNPPAQPSCTEPRSQRVR